VKRRRVGIISVVPSPYQRDLFAALSRRPELDLSVYYMEAASPDSPWPEKPLAAYEQVLPGFWFPVGSARVHMNWSLPRVRDFDVIVLNSLMSITAQRLMRGPLRRVPWIFMGERLGQRRGGWHERLSSPLHRAGGIAAVGSWAEADYRARFPEPRCFRLPYYCDLNGFLAQPRHSVAGEVVFLFCGQMIARKGVDLLIEAFAKLPSGRLLLIGREAELPELLERVPAPVRERIEYAGFHAPERLPEHFARADVFVLPSRYDGWGVVVNQAIAAGLPVICSDQVGAGFDLVAKGKNGVRFAAGDVASLETAMRQFVDAPALIEPYGASSRALAREWTPDAGAAKWLEAFETVLAG
jgi:glycosyltransferase involved in cell wall biosynthesis